MESFGLDPMQIRGHLILGCGAYFEDRPEQTTICHLRGLKIHIRDTADLFLADEIFRGCSYPIPFSEPAVVIDIGMNVGMAALEFANDPRVKAVYAYEPFPVTFKMATDNFELNPELSSKIFPYCFGLGTADESRTVEYSEILRAGMTTRGIPTTNFSKGPIRKESIELREITSTIIPILHKYEGVRFILKMDCEGDEFSLIPRLDQFGLLDVFDLMMIEFHHQAPEPLLRILDDRGFLTTDSTRSEQILFQGNKSNMIYAAKDPSFLE